MMKNDNENALAHGAGAGLLALFGMFGRCADDVARIGVHRVDDVGRACVTSTDDIGSLMSRSGDNLFQPIDDFHVPNYVDALRFEASTSRVVVNEGDEGVSLAPHVVREVAEATIKIVDLNNSEDKK
jgi:hypothetical protein